LSAPAGDASVRAARAEPAAHEARITAGILALMVMLVLIWGCNWPILKLAVGEFEPLTYRTLTMPFAALAMMAIAHVSGDSLRLPRRVWMQVAVLSLFNVALWNVLVLFGVRNLPAGRSAILGYTMPVWSVLFSMFLLHEPLSRRKLAGLACGMIGMATLLGEDIRNLGRAPEAALLILAGAASWGIGTVLLRKWKPAIPQNTLTGWMMLLGFVPVPLLMPFFTTQPMHVPSGAGFFAAFYSIFVAGALAHWTWFRLVRRVPIIVSSMISLPVPVVGVFGGMLIFGEQPGLSEWLALVFVLVGVVAVLWQPRVPPAGRTHV
jgi:drug/metabolite transporter (DMT)-like permease